MRRHLDQFPLCGDLTTEICAMSLCCNFTTILENATICLSNISKIPEKPIKRIAYVLPAEPGRRIASKHICNTGTKYAHGIYKRVISATIPALKVMEPVCSYAFIELAGVPGCSNALKYSG